MSDELPPLDDDMRGLFAGMRADVHAPAAARARVASRLSASLGIPLGVAGGLEATAAEGGAAGAPDMAMAPPVDASPAVDVAGALVDPDVIASAAPVAVALVKSASVAAPVAAAATGVGTVGAVATTTTASVGVLAMLTKPIVVGAFVAGSMLGGGTVKIVDEVTEKPRVVYLPAAAHVEDVERALDSAPPVEEPPSEIEDKPATAKGREKPRVTRKPAATTSSDDARAPDEASRALAKERAFLEVARTALSRGDAGAALSSLEKHRAQFATGKLAEERDALLVLALVGAGRAGEAERAASRFERTYPRSLMLATVKAAIAK